MQGKGMVVILLSCTLHCIVGYLRINTVLEEFVKSYCPGKRLKSP